MMQEMIRQGRYAVPFGPSGTFSSICVEDIAKVITAILADPAGHAGQTYPLYGPQELSPPEIAAIVGETLGKEVRYEQVTGEEWVKEITGRNIPYLEQHVADMHGRGLMAGTNSNVERLTGHKPKSIAEFTKQNQAIRCNNA